MKYALLQPCFNVMVFSKTSESGKPKQDSYPYFNGTLQLKQLPLGLASAPGAFHLLRDLVFKFFLSKLPWCTWTRKLSSAKRLRFFYYVLSRPSRNSRKAVSKQKAPNTIYCGKWFVFWGMLCHKKRGCGSREGGSRRKSESPSNWKELRAELALVGFYRKFFPGFWENFRTSIPNTEDGEDVSLHKGVRRYFTRVEIGTAISAHAGLFKQSRWVDLNHRCIIFWHWCIIEWKARRSRLIFAYPINSLPKNRRTILKQNVSFPMWGTLRIHWLGSLKCHRPSSTCVVM